MLKMKSACERCTAALPADRGACPNCSGVLLPRPPRAAALLERFPPQG